MRVQEILTLFPQSADIMMEYGLHCFDCHLGGVETLEEGCRIHSMDDETIDALVDDINVALESAPERERVFTVTAAAAEGIAAIAKAEGREHQFLRVAVDRQGEFCLEFCDDPGECDVVFSCAAHPDVRVCVSPLTLQRVGGGAIDMRDGRLKLDLPEDMDCCCTGEECSCGGVPGEV